MYKMRSVMQHHGPDFWTPVEYLFSNVRGRWEICPHLAGFQIRIFNSLMDSNQFSLAGGRATLVVCSPPVRIPFEKLLL